MMYRDIGTTTPPHTEKLTGNIGVPTSRNTGVTISHNSVATVTQSFAALTVSQSAVVTTQSNIPPIQESTVADKEISSRFSKSVTVGFSGGIDSTVAVLMMKERFETVVAATMWLYDGQEESFELIKAMSDALDVRHIILDFRRAFRDEVVSKYIQSYESGLTPNPCIICNKAIKYGLFLDTIETDYLALGHYARKALIDGEYRLFRSNAARKDQSYNLYSLTQRQLERLLFPIGEFSSKDEVKSYYSEHFAGKTDDFEAGLSVQKRLKRVYEPDKNAKVPVQPDLPAQPKSLIQPESLIQSESLVQPESMGACFLIGKVHYEYLKSIGARTSRRGNFVDKCGNILGEHDGISTYTIGQKPRIRKKNPVDGMTDPYRVLGVICGFDVVRNEVIIGDESDVLAHRIYLTGFNIISYRRRAEIPHCNNLFHLPTGKTEITNDERVKHEFAKHKFTDNECSNNPSFHPLCVEIRLSQWSEVYTGRCWIQDRGICNEKKQDSHGNAWRGLCSEKSVLVFESDSMKLMRAPAPGQAAVLYIGDELIGGGIIEKSLPFCQS